MLQALGKQNELVKGRLRPETSLSDQVPVPNLASHPSSTTVTLLSCEVWRPAFWHLSGSCFFLNVCGFEPLMMSQEANLLINLIVHGHLGKSEAQPLGLSFAEYTKMTKVCLSHRRKDSEREKLKREKIP